jgi:hypothetical protein
MANNSELFILLAAAAAAFFILKKTDNTGASSEVGYSGGSFQSLANPTEVSSPAVVVSKDTIIKAPSSGRVKDASSSRLAEIDTAAKANPSKVLYYPDEGIVTIGGLGYSTANPSAYIPKTSTASTPSSNPYITNSSYFKLG